MKRILVLALLSVGLVLYTCVIGPALTGWSVSSSIFFALVVFAVMPLVIRAEAWLSRRDAAGRPHRWSEKRERGG